MTIAALYVSPEGIVLGADSTSSFFNAAGVHYFDFAQKLFEIGEKSTLGCLTWGMGGLGDLSYRHMLATFDDDLTDVPAKSIEEVASRWAATFDAKYRTLPEVQRAMALGALQQHDKSDPSRAGTRSGAEEAEYIGLSNAAFVGFCIGGYVMPSRDPVAVTVQFIPGDPVPTIKVEPKHTLVCYGMPNAMNRLIHGMDDDIFAAIMDSGKWTGSPKDINDILECHRLLPRAQLPLRDAVDYVHAGIYLTIKATKFSVHPQVCGGPIEIAIISSDRKFRWVRHKEWDAAIAEGAM